MMTYKEGLPIVFHGFHQVVSDPTALLLIWWFYQCFQFISDGTEVQNYCSSCIVLLHSIIKLTPYHNLKYIDNEYEECQIHGLVLITEIENRGEHSAIDAMTITCLKHSLFVDVDRLSEPQ